MDGVAKVILLAKILKIFLKIASEKLLQSIMCQ